jgi:formylglycine-generating enzyme required for sulfatase activity
MTTLYRLGIVAALGAALIGSSGKGAAARLEALRNGRDGAELVLVPAGNYRAENTLLKAPVIRRLERYPIYKYLVTVGQYRRFCRATGREAPTGSAARRASR